MAIKINWQDLQKRIINWQEVQKVMLNWNQIRPSWPTPTPTYQVVWDFATAWASGQLPTGWVARSWREPNISNGGISYNPENVSSSAVDYKNIPLFMDSKKITFKFIYSSRQSSIGWATQIGWYSSWYENGWRAVIYPWNQPSLLWLTIRAWRISDSNRPNLISVPSWDLNYYTVTWELDLINKTYTVTIVVGDSLPVTRSMQIADQDIETIKADNSYLVINLSMEDVILSYAEMSIFE